MGRPTAAKKPSRTYVISLDNRKARGSGHERPEEILAAARELFLEHGIENVSTRQIATRVGISQTALYVYFRDKEMMLDSLVEVAFRKLGTTLACVEAKCSDPIDYLRAAIPEYIRFGFENPDEYRLAFLLRDARRKASRLPEEKRRIGLEVFEAMETRIAEGFASGALRSPSGSAHGSAQALWAAIHGLVALLLAYPEFGWVPLDELIAIHTDMLLHGLIDQRHKSACKPAATAKAIDQPVKARRSSNSKRGA
jgi:AcrR family transcriptional regulator